MTRSAGRMTWLDFVPVAGLAFIIASPIYTRGVGDGKTVELTHRIEMLEEKVKLLDAIDRRTERIDAKLEILVPTRRALPEGESR